jgi:hypothetical protein
MSDRQKLIKLAARLTNFLNLMQPDPDKSNTPLYLTGNQIATIVAALRRAAMA